MVVTAYRTGDLGIHRPAGHAHPEPVRVPVAVRSSARPVTVQRAPPANTFRAVRIRQGPSMYEMEGPAQPRRASWPVARPCRRRAPPAGARYPRKEPVSRLLPRSRGYPQVVPVSERQKHFYRLGGQRARARGQPFQVSRYPRLNPQKAAGYPDLTVVIHGHIHSLSTGLGASRGTL
jgi:hypothetical protein